MRCVRSGVSAIVLAALLAGCGGGSGSGGGGSGTVVQPGTGTSSPTPTASACSLRSRQDWILATMREWYLFPETLPADVNPAGYGTPDAYLDALTATARAQGRDRYFTYLTSIAEETAYYTSGSSAGFGFRLTSDGASTLTVAESFEGGNALQAGIDRGTQILAIGTSSGDLRDVSTLFSTQGSAGVQAALGPDTNGTTRVLRVRDPNGSIRTVTLAKSDFTLTPVSNRYGAQILTDPNGGGRVGYVNLRTFINTADPALRSAFAGFKAQGIDKVIVDLRYNGGGLVSIAQLFGDLLGGARATSDVFSYTSFRPEKSANDTTRFFGPQPEAIAPTRIAFIGTRSTASASELVINGMLPFFRANLGLIGTNTYGKPVGQVAIDKSECDDRLRVIAFATQNANRQGSYFNGLAGTVEASCAATDDLSQPLGSVREASVKAALDFVAGRSCSAIGGLALARVAAAPTELLSPDRPSTAQREVPGLF